jgi:hypothetical protein
MEKMTKGFDGGAGDWRYTLVDAGGKTAGATGGKGAELVQFCADCHAGVEDQDYLFFLPDAYRK